MNCSWQFCLRFFSSMKVTQTATHDTKQHLEIFRYFKIYFIGTFLPILFSMLINYTDKTMNYRSKNNKYGTIERQRLPQNFFQSFWYWGYKMNGVKLHLSCWKRNKMGPPKKQQVQIYLEYSCSIKIYRSSN